MPTNPMYVSRLTKLGVLKRTYRANYMVVKPPMVARYELAKPGLPREGPKG